MATKEKVDNARKQYEKESNSELIRIMSQFQHFAPQHIAAKQLIEERKLEEQSTSMKLAWIAIGIPITNRF